MAEEVKKAEEKPAEMKLPELPNYQRKGEKLAIIGCSDSKDGAPPQGSEWERWGVNNLFVAMSGFDAMFEIHSITTDGQGRYFRRGKADFRSLPVVQYLEQLGKLNVPIFMQRPWPMIPKAVPYPFKYILDRYGTYFTNSISWQIALGMEIGFKEIGIWGVDMATSEAGTNQEYAHQRPSCEYMIGIALGRGIKIYIPPQADLCKSRFIYGLQDEAQDAFDAKLEKVHTEMAKRRQANYSQEIIQHDSVQQYIGGMNAISEMRKVWGNWASMGKEPHFENI